MKAVVRCLTWMALVPVSVVALWAVGWRHWTAVVGATLIAGLIAFAVPVHSRHGRARLTA